MVNLFDVLGHGDFIETGWKDKCLPKSRQSKDEFFLISRKNSSLLKISLPIIPSGVVFESPLSTSVIWKLTTPKPSNMSRNIFHLAGAEPEPEMGAELDQGQGLRIQGPYMELLIGGSYAPMHFEFSLSGSALADLSELFSQELSANVLGRCWRDLVKQFI